MPFATASRAINRRFKSADDPRVKDAYDALLYILSHVSSDSVAAARLGVSRSTVGRWKRTGFSPGQLDSHYKTIIRQQAKLERQVDAALRKAGPGARFQIRPIPVLHPGADPSEPGVLRVHVAGATLEEILKIFLSAQSKFYFNDIENPVYSAFYLSIKFGGKYKGKFWNGESITEKREGAGTDLELIRGSVYRTKLARSCADLHPYDEPRRGGNNLILYECLTDHFYQPDTQILDIGFYGRKPTI